MKKKCLKIATILITGLLAMHVGSNGVKGACESGITVSFNKGDKVNGSGSGLLSTTSMTASAVDGSATYNAYCSWYENDTPPSGKVCLKKLNYDTGDATGVGLEYILTASTGYGNSTKEDRIIRTAAINLYLTIRGDALGNNCSGSANFNRLDFTGTLAPDFIPQDGLFRRKNENGNDIYPDWSMAKNMNTADSNVFETNWNEIFKNHYSDFLISAYPMIKNVHDLVKEAIRQANIYQAPILKFTKDSETAKFENKNGYYEKTYTLDSNFNFTLNSNTTTVNIEGYGTVSSNSQDVKVDFNNNAKTVTVRIPVSIVETIGSEKTKVTVTVATDYKKAIIYALSEETNRCIYQDVVLIKIDGNGVDKSVERITASTDDVIQIEYKKCYKYSISCEQATCKNTNSANERPCTSRLSPPYYTTSGSCDPDDLDIKASGKQMIKLIDGVCSLYCTETATASYPGNVSPAIKIETNFTWPTNINGLYPLKTSAKLDCKVEMDDGSAVTQACLNAATNRTYQYDNGNEVAQLKYNDTSADKNINLQQHCISGSSVNGESVTIINNCYYTLPNGENSLISKKTVNFVNQVAVEVATATSNYILTNYSGILPVAGYHWKDEGVFNETIFKNSYELAITNLPLGYAGQFTSELKKNPYVCNYKVTKTIEGGVPCKCPPGTKNEGLYIYSYIKDNTLTCAEAQNKYCDDPTVDPTCPDDSNKPGERPAEFVECMDQYDNYNYCAKENCYDSPEPFCIDKDTGDKKFLTDCLKNNDWATCEQLNNCTDTPDGSCPEDSTHPERNCQTWVNMGNKEDTCITDWCNDPSCDGPNCFLCPPDSDIPLMDISSCVSGQRAQGKGIQEAKTTCERECYISCNQGSNCPPDGRLPGAIIYRTISLENPFPSMNGDKSIDKNQPNLVALNHRPLTSLNINEKTFNQKVKGRYPGTNWNGVQLVYDKILNNRGYDGSAIYQEATPLYTFNLDATAIKKIRDYNTKQAKESAGYADWDLTCTNGAYCISEFVHKSGITTATGNSILDSSNSTCANASNKSSFISCYNQP